VLNKTDHESTGLRQRGTATSPGSADTPEFQDRQAGRRGGEGISGQAGRPAWMGRNFRTGRQAGAEGKEFQDKQAGRHGGEGVEAAVPQGGQQPHAPVAK